MNTDERRKYMREYNQRLEVKQKSELPKYCYHPNQTMTYDPETHEWAGVCKDCEVTRFWTTMIPHEVVPCPICGRPAIWTPKRPAYHNYLEDPGPRIGCPQCRGKR